MQPTSNSAGNGIGEQTMENKRIRPLGAQVVPDWLAAQLAVAQESRSREKKDQALQSSGSIWLAASVPSAPARLPAGHE